MLDTECDDEEDLGEDEFEGYVDQGMDDRNEEGVVDGYAHEVIEDEAVGQYDYQLLFQLTCISTSIHQDSIEELLG
ncbi:hypothetical protein EMCRGX_G005563 [Ephydatia muelleri]